MIKYQRSQSIFAVDIGNTQIKIGVFSDLDSNDAQSDSLPVPYATFSFDPLTDFAESLAEFLNKPELSNLQQRHWMVCSVSRPNCSAFQTWVESQFPDDPFTQLSITDIPVTYDVHRPERLGMDRAITGYAANQSRQPEQPAIVIDLGTAITIDSIDAQGTFQGGAILPGLHSSAKILNESTDALPYIPIEQLNPSANPIGKDTESALKAGLFWGSVGAIKELIAQYQANFNQSAIVFLTGGAAEKFVDLIGECQIVPHFTLSGIAQLAYQSIEADA
jgi:type III pantothenate kinase